MYRQTDRLQACLHDAAFCRIFRYKRKPLISENEEDAAFFCVANFKVHFGDRNRFDCLALLQTERQRLTSAAWATRL